MKKIIAKLHKHLGNGKQFNLPKNSFAVIGHFDYFTFEIVSSFKELYAQKAKSVESADDIGGSKLADELQSVYLWNIENVVSDLEAFTSLDYSVNGIQLPFCVLTMADDRIRMNMKGIPTPEKLQKELASHLKKYQELLDDFLRKNQYLNVVIELRAFHTLSCMDVVLVFRTNCMYAVHEFILNMPADAFLYTSYTVFGISNALFSQKIDQNTLILYEKNIELSLRIIFKPNVRILAGLGDLRRQLSEQLGVPENEFLQTTLAGHHQVLLHFQKNSFALFKQMFGPKGILRPNGIISVCRPTLRFLIHNGNMQKPFSTYSDNPQNEGNKNPDEKEVELESLISSYDELMKQWSIIGSQNINNESNEPYLRQKIYGDNLRVILEQHISFFRVLRSQSKQGINPEVYGALVPSISVLEQNIHIFSVWIRYFFDIEKLPQDSLADIFGNFLSETQAVVEIIGKQMSNIVHMQRNYVEERGLYQNEISATAKFALGYIQYANNLGKELLKMEEKNNSFSCYVYFQNSKEKVKATQFFSFLPLIDIEKVLYKRKIDVGMPPYFIGISIGQRYALMGKQVVFAITHEVLHFHGERLREFRAQCIVKSMSRWLANTLISRKYLDYSKLYHIEKKDLASNQGFDDFFVNENDKLQEIGDLHAIKLADRINSHVIALLSKESFDQGLKWTYMHYLKLELIAIFDKMLNEPYDQSFKELDLPVEVANIYLHTKHEEYEIFHKWYTSTKVEDRGQIAFEATEGFIKGDLEALRMIIEMTEQKIEQYLMENYQKIVAYSNVRYENGKLVRGKVSPPLRPNRDTTAETLKFMIETFGHVYQEAYSDIIAIQLLDITSDEYLRYVWYKKDVGVEDYWRIWVVLNYAFKKDAPGDSRWAIIKENAKSMKLFDDEINSYLNAVMNDKKIKKLIQSKRSIVPQGYLNHEAQDDGEFLFLYANYQILHDKCLHEQEDQCK